MFNFSKTKFPSAAAAVTVITVSKAHATPKCIFTFLH